MHEPLAFIWSPRLSRSSIMVPLLFGRSPNWTKAPTWVSLPLTQRQHVADNNFAKEQNSYSVVYLLPTKRRAAARKKKQKLYLKAEQHFSAAGISSSSSPDKHDHIRSGEKSRGVTILGVVGGHVV